LDSVFSPLRVRSGKRGLYRIAMRLLHLHGTSRASWDPCHRL